MDGYVAESWENILPHVEDDLRMNAFPEIEGLISSQLSDEKAVQFDAQEGTLLIAGSVQQLLSRDEVSNLIAFLIEVSSCK